MVPPMNETCFTFFDTAVGRCGIAWGSRGVVAVLLPEKTDAVARARLLRRLPDAREATPPPEIQRAIDGIVALLAGEARDLADVRLDLGVVPVFYRRVYEVARTIRPGSTLSYGEVATRLGEPRAAREVGEALGKNPFPIVVPCHRVLAAGGKLGGFSARGGIATKLRLLEIEGALAPETPMLFDDLPRAVR
jgi:methylated-DNA-[protein]-cysteine S-methyltransferase